MPTADNNQVLGRVTAKIAQAADPERILLFGSRARGNANPTSDFDIALIFSNREQVRSGLQRAHRALWPRPFPLDLLGFARNTLEQGTTALAREIKREGQTLYVKDGFSR